MAQDDDLVTVIGAGVIGLTTAVLWGMHVIVDHFGIDPGLLEQLRDTPVRMMSTCSKHMR